MHLNQDRLQEIAEKAVRQPDGTWRLSDEYAPEFFKIINSYIKKSATRSDWQDPEDAFAETRLSVWRALRSYGPHPMGHPFVYALKLRVNNTLTNRYKKRKSFKSRINYEASSFEDLVANTGYDPGVSDADPCIMKEEIRAHVAKKNLVKTKRITPTLEEKLSNLDLGKKKEYATTLLAGITGVLPDDIEKDFKEFCVYLKMRTALYNDLKEKNMNDLNKIQIGDKFTSPGGKIVQLKKVARMKDESTGDIIDGYFVEVMATGKDVFVSNDYIQTKVKPLKVEPEPVVVEKLTEVEIPVTEQKPVEPPKMRVTVAALAPVEKKVMFVAVHPVEPIVEGVTITTIMPPDVPVVEVDMSEKEVHKPKHREGTQRSLILDLLKKGPQTRKGLAQALIDAGLTKNDDVNKVAFNVSIVVKNLEKEGHKVVTVERGTYKIDV